MSSTINSHTILTNSNNSDTDSNKSITNTQKNKQKINYNHKNFKFNVKANSESLIYIFKQSLFTRTLLSIIVNQDCLFIIKCTT